MYSQKILEEIKKYNINSNKSDLLYQENYTNFDNQIQLYELSCYLEDFINESIDMDEGFGGKLRPVFVVLLYSDSTFDHVAEKVVKGQKYWHAALGFGPALSRTYSFNFGEADANKIKGGLSFESLEFYKKEHPTGTMEVSCVFLKKDKYKSIKHALEYYIRNKEKTKYSFVNLVFSLLGIKTKNGLKMNLVCSTFVDTILKAANISLSGNLHTNLTKPDDLSVNSKKEKQFKIYSGPIINYNEKKAADLVERLSNNINNDYFGKK
jgi:hypothetical protein